jgi:hypothetical protein
MAYLYGDSTTFPVDENFLETLRDVCDAVAALLRADGSLMRARERAEEARRFSLKETAELEQIAGGLVRTLEPPMSGGVSPSAARAAGRVLQAARGVLESARGECGVRRDEALRGVERELHEVRGMVARHLEGLLARRQLPQTVWRLSWRAGVGEARATAKVQGAAAMGLTTTMDLDIPAAHLWAGAVRVKQLDRKIDIELPREGGLLRRAGKATHRLDGWMVTEVEVAPERVAMVLRRHARGPADGLEIVVRDQSGPAPCVRRLRPGGGPMGAEILLQGASTRNVERVWRRVAETMRDLERRRSRLLGASFAGKPIAQLDRPARLASAMVEAVAPLSREIRRKSSAVGELSLKRDIGGGKREELFVPIAELTRRFDGVGGAERIVLQVMGLAGESDATDAEAAAFDDALDAALAGASMDVEASIMRNLRAEDMSADAEEIDESDAVASPPAAPARTAGDSTAASGDFDTSDDEETREAGGRTRAVMMPPLQDVASDDKSVVDPLVGRIVN